MLARDGGKSSGRARFCSLPRGDDVIVKAEVDPRFDVMICGNRQAMIGDEFWSWRRCFQDICIWICPDVGSASAAALLVSMVDRNSRSV